MNTNGHMSIKERILGRIKSQELSMRPRLHFTFHVAALAATALAALFVSVFIFNFISFSVRLNAENVFLGFGPRGIAMFLSRLPWGFIVLDAVLVVLLERLSRRFRFGWKVPGLYLLAGIFLVTVSVGYAMDKGSGINELLLRAADERRLPAPVAKLYGLARRPFPEGSGACRCKVVAIDGNVVTVEDRREDKEHREGTTTLRVVVVPKNPRAATSSLKVGDTVLVAGDEEKRVIRAFGLKKISEEQSDRRMQKHVPEGNDDSVSGEQDIQKENQRAASTSTEEQDGNRHERGRRGIELRLTPLNQ